MERFVQIILLLPPLGLLENKWRNKGPLGASCGASSRTARCGGGDATTRAADSPVAPGDLLGALKLQAVMSAEDFSKYEKMVVPPSKEERTKKREQLLKEKVQFQNRLRKHEAGHVEQIAKLEADVAKQRAMLQGVREQLEAVNDEVCALRALVADPSLPTCHAPEPPSLPPTRTHPPPQTQDLLDIVHPPDQEMENEDELEWKPVRRLAHWDRRNNVGDQGVH